MDRWREGDCQINQSINSSKETAIDGTSNKRNQIVKRRRRVRHLDHSTGSERYRRIGNPVAKSDFTGEVVVNLLTQATAAEVHSPSPLLWSALHSISLYLVRSSSIADLRSQVRRPCLSLPSLLLHSFRLSRAGQSQFTVCALAFVLLQRHPCYLPNFL